MSNMYLVAVDTASVDIKHGQPVLAAAAVLQRVFFPSYTRYIRRRKWDYSIDPHCPERDHIRRSLCFTSVPFCLPLKSARGCSVCHIVPYDIAKYVPAFDLLLH